MCWMITLGVPTNGVAFLRNYHSTRGGVSVAERASRAHRNFFPASDYLFDVTRGGCSCGIGLPGTSSIASNQDRLLRKYTEAGWSDEKIARALRDSKQAKGRSDHHPRSTEPLNALRDLVHILVSEVDDIRFVASDDSLEIPLNEKRSISLSSFTALKDFPCHVLLDIHL